MRFKRRYQIMNHLVFKDLGCRQNSGNIDGLRGLRDGRVRIQCLEVRSAVMAFVNAFCLTADTSGSEQTKYITRLH